MNKPVEFTREQMRTLIMAQIKRNGWSQREAAKRIGVTNSFLSEIKTGKRGPSGKVLSYFGFERVVTFRFKDPPDGKLCGQCGAPSTAHETVRFKGVPVTFCPGMPYHSPLCICCDCEQKRGRVVL